jgi:hypothetical protein
LGVIQIPEIMSMHTDPATSIFVTAMLLVFPFAKPLRQDEGAVSRDS